MSATSLPAVSLPSSRQHPRLVNGLMIPTFFALLRCQACLLLNVRFATAIDTRSYKFYYNDVLAQRARRVLTQL